MILSSCEWLPISVSQALAIQLNFEQGDSVLCVMARDAWRHLTAARLAGNCEALDVLLVGSDLHRPLFVKLYTIDDVCEVPDSQTFLLIFHFPSD